MAQELARRGFAVELATDERAEKYGADFPARAVYRVPSATFTSRSPVAVAKTLGRLGSGFLQARRLLEMVQQATDLCGSRPHEALQHADEFREEFESKALFFTPHLSPSIARYFRSYAETVARMRLARVALAVMEAEEKSGHWPEVPPGPPLLDPFTRSGADPFVYEIIDDEVILRVASDESLDLLIASVSRSR